MVNSGIYAITNTVNGNRYIGSSANISKRWSGHKKGLNNNNHHSGYLQNAWNKYGAENFEFSMLECCEIDHLLEREQFYIDNESPAYNMRPTAGSNLGIKFSDAARRNMRAAHMGNTNHLGHEHTEASLEKMRAAHKGKPGHKHTPETLALLSGRVVSAATRALLSAAGLGNTNCLGHAVTEETRLKISLANKLAWAKRKAQMQPRLEAA